MKTRLAEELGDRAALGVYRKLLEATRGVSDQMEVRRQVWYSQAAEEDDGWPPARYEKYVQQGKGLGARMEHAFRQAFEEGAAKAVIIGSDCPGLRPGHLRQAYRALGQADVVAGPSEDGGYYLLGMNRLHPPLFSGIDWSTGRVLEQTLRACRRQGLEWALLETLNDVDTKDDWDALRHTL